MMGDVDGPVIEVLASDPDEESPAPGRRPRVLIVAALLGALVIGAVGGAQVARAVQKAHAAAPPPTRLSAAALPPAGGQVTSTGSGPGWVTDVDLAIVSAGPRVLSRAVVSWAGVDSTPVGSEPSLQPISRLSPGVAQTVRLRLYRSCADAQPTPPPLLVTWSQAGVAQSQLVNAAGLDQLWTALLSRCGQGDSGIDALDIQVGPADQRLSVIFRNQGNAAMTISPLGILGGFQLTSPGPAFFVGPNTARTVPVHVHIADCRAVLQNLYAAGLVYRVTVEGQTALQPSYTSDGLSSELAQFAYRVCAKSGS